MRLNKNKKKLINEMIRVNQAGEFGAQKIYEGQLAVLPKDKTIKKMAQQENIHLEKFNKLMVKKRVRPTALSPIWSIGGFFLGASSAIISRKAAMACTLAVEEVIDKHYEEQEKKLTKDIKDDELLKLVKKFRKEEIEHKNIAINNNAKDANGYELLSFGIKNITKLAIKLSKKI
tara:strand:- start:11087 stop:11611 length:525 start_codon:yes stop_codon:yes gene_type:complete